jgi:hypothetical protein
MDGGSPAGRHWNLLELSEAAMPVRDPPTRDDRVLAYTRGLSLFIVPFLLVAFVILYLFPGDTTRLFAWTIHPTMTPMVLASAYLGGAWFFLRVLREPHWNVVKTGFLSVALFAGLLGVATVLHWDKFNHGHVVFWIWAALYFVAPFLVIGAWLANRRYAAPPTPEERRLGGVSRLVIALVGLGALGQGVVMFVSPDTVILHWPWLLTPLTCRVIGAIFCLGSAGLGVWVDPRWTTVRLMLEVEVVMIVLMIVAAVRGRASLDSGSALGWLLLVGFATVLAGSAWLWVVHEVRPRQRHDPPH